MIGNVFGRLTVLSEAGQDKYTSRLYLCKCECGSEVVKAGWLMRRGDTKSCGCLRAENLRTISITHGARKTRAYSVWWNMKSRCEREKSKYFKDYGARGIKVCDRWQDFGAFLADMGQPPDGMTLERVDNSKGYEPSNCKWADRKSQASNRRSNRIIELNGQSKTLNEWAEATGIERRTIAFRLKSGWSVEAALTTPVKRQLLGR